MKFWWLVFLLVISGIWRGAYNHHCHDYVLSESYGRTVVRLFHSLYLLHHHQFCVSTTETPETIAFTPLLFNHTLGFPGEGPLSSISSSHFNPFLTDETPDAINDTGFNPFLENVNTDATSPDAHTDTGFNPFLTDTSAASQSAETTYFSPEALDSDCDEDDSLVDVNTPPASPPSVSSVGSARKPRAPRPKREQLKARKTSNDYIASVLCADCCTKKCCQKVLRFAEVKAAISLTFSMTQKEEGEVMYASLRHTMHRDERGKPAFLFCWSGTLTKTLTKCFLSLRASSNATTPQH